MKKKTVYLEVRERATQKVLSRKGPFDPDEAIKVTAVMLVNANIDKYGVYEVVEGRGK